MRIVKNFKICIISDTHNHHKKVKLPDADVIIHCGDFTSVGYEHEIKNFMKWYSNLHQFEHKIIIAGNHDQLFEGNSRLAKSLIPNNVIYLEDSGVEINGLNFYGSPVQKMFMNWAFNKPEEKLKLHWEAIPTDTDILITHSPPYGIGDYVPRNGEHCGSPSLFSEVVERIKPKIHCFGHIHEGYGIKEYDFIKFINASNLDGDYMCVNDAILIEL